MSVVKYFNKRSSGDKFLYDDDYNALKVELEQHKIDIKKSIDAEIMDLSDEIAYAAHDLEDALSFGLVTIDEITQEFYIDEEYKSAYSTLVSIVHGSRDIAKEARSSSEEYFTILKKEVTGSIVNILCQDIGLVNGKLGYTQHEKLARGLKKLLFKAILRKKDIQHYEKMGENVLRGLFEVYSDEHFNKNKVLLPAELRNLPSCKNRLVIDYLAGMMDSFAIQEYDRYFGKGSSQKLYS